MMTVSIRISFLSLTFHIAPVFPRRTTQAAAAAREEAAVIAYKAETDSLRAAMVSVQKTERVKEDAVHRRFQALEKALMAAEGSAKAWKERAAAVESLLKQVRPTGTGRIGIGYGYGFGFGIVRNASPAYANPRGVPGCFR